MRKIISLILVLLLTFGAFGCFFQLKNIGGGDNVSSVSESKAQSESGSETPQVKTLGSLEVGSKVKVSHSEMGDIEFLVVDKDHDGYPENSTTLLTEKVIALRCFDAKEPNNSDSDSKKYGNNMYSVSNLDQWLNSSAVAGQWYSARHSADQAPDNDYVWENYNEYDQDAGFLAGFDAAFVAALKDTTINFALYDKMKVSFPVSVTRKFFLPSTTEVYGISEKYVYDGSQLSYFSANTNDIRMAQISAYAAAHSEYSVTAGKNVDSYWLRTPHGTGTGKQSVCIVLSSGVGGSYASAGKNGVRPLCNLSSETVISETPDENGYYSLSQSEIPPEPGSETPHVRTLGSLKVGSRIKVSHSEMGNIEFFIADKDHVDYPENSTTLLTEKLITFRCFDAKEPNNSVSDRKFYGNNKYSVSNIDQWLNSSASAGQWYSARHSADQAPDNDHVWENYNEYDQDAGFLAGFDSAFVAALKDTTIKVVLNTVVDGGGYESITRKFFLPSRAELFGASENSIMEGSLLSYFSANTNAIRVAVASEYAAAHSEISRTAGAAWRYFLRTPESSYSYKVYDVFTDGSGNSNAVYGSNGVRPLCNLSSDTVVSEEPDENGYYSLVFN